MSDLMASYFDLTVTLLGILGVSYEAFRRRAPKSISDATRAGETAA